MYSYPVDYAQKNIWCTPKQDTQSRIAPPKISRAGGVWVKFYWNWEWTSLPLTTGEKFHVYIFNAIRPSQLGLPDLETQWVRVSDVMRDQHLIVDIYSNRGIQMPRYATWYRVTRNGTLLFAVQFQPTININLDTEQLYFRFYRNAYYSSQASDPVNDYLQSSGQTLTTNADLVTFQNTYQQVKTDMANGTRPTGAVYAFINGYFVNDVSPFNVSLPATAEWVYDSAIFKVYDVNIVDLVSFTSTLDQENKFLIRDSDPLVDQIVYLDDTDLFLYQPNSTAYWQGVYYHRNDVRAQRMLTHKDYSVPVDFIDQYASQNTELGWIDPTKLVLRLQLRYSGWSRQLVDEANRINALYKLPDDEITQAMIGVNATVPNWTANTLESSAYTAIMSASGYGDITPLMVQNALGYNAMSKLMGDTPSALIAPSGQLTTTLPYGLVAECTGYEFDANGLLLGSNQHQNGTTYVAGHAGAAMVEALYGTGSQFLNDFEGQQTLTIAPDIDFRVYTCPINSGTGLPSYVWTDITDTSQYAFINGVVTLLTDPTQFYPLIRTMEYHLYYEIDIPIERGVLDFVITHNTIRNGNNVNIQMEIPLERYDIWVNGYRLVKDIDYIVNFPKIVVTTSAYFINPETDPQHVSIRGAGLYNPNATYQPTDDTGFVMWGMLSNNHRYDLRDDKVQSFQVGGKTLMKSSLKFAEDGSTPVLDDATNGSPYRVSDILVPIRNLVNTTVTAYRQIALQTDEVVENYLSSKLTEVDPTNPSVIPRLWPLYSPFFSMILADLMSGVLAPSYLNDKYTDQQVLTSVQSYEIWLPFDPLTTGHTVDVNNAKVYPHPFPTVQAVTINMYQFLQRVNHLYFNSVLDLSSYVSIIPITS